MIRGVCFKVSQTFDSKVLYEILSCLKVENYSWYNISSQNEVWLDRNGNYAITNASYNGEEFLRAIDICCYVIFLKLQAYLDTHKHQEIHNYKEFLESDCQLLLLIHDCEFVEIYAKDYNTVDILFKNALKNNYKNVEFITEKNDTRNKMDVL